MVLSFVETRSRKSCWERFCHATSREVKVIIKPTKHHLPQIHQNPQPPTSPNPQHPPTQFHYRANPLFFRSDKKWAVGWCQRAWSLEIFQSQGSPSLKTSYFSTFSPKNSCQFLWGSQPIKASGGLTASRAVPGRFWRWCSPEFLACSGKGLLKGAEVSTCKAGALLLGKVIFAREIPCAGALLFFFFFRKQNSAHYIIRCGDIFHQCCWGYQLSFVLVEHFDIKSRISFIPSFFFRHWTSPYHPISTSRWFPRLAINSLEKNPRFRWDFFLGNLATLKWGHWAMWIPVVWWRHWLLLLVEVEAWRVTTNQISCWAMKKGRCLGDFSWGWQTTQLYRDFKQPVLQGK